MQVSALLLCWGSYRWAHNLWVLIIYLFFLPVMFPSVLPRLATDLAVSVSWYLENSLFLRLPSQVRVAQEFGEHARCGLSPFLPLLLSFLGGPLAHPERQIVTVQQPQKS